MNHRPRPQEDAGSPAAGRDRASEGGNRQSWWSEHNVAALAAVLGAVAAIITALGTIVVPLFKSEASQEGSNSQLNDPSPSASASRPQDSPQSFAPTTTGTPVVSTPRQESALEICAPDSCSALTASVNRYNASDVVLINATKEEVETLDDLPKDRTQGFQWKRAIEDAYPGRVIDAGGYSFELVLTGRTADVVVITDVRLRVLEKGEIPLGAHLTDRPECGGELEPIKIRAFLDPDPVIVRLYSPDSDMYSELDRDWAFSVARDDPELLILDIFAYQSMVAFVIEIDYTVDGRKGTMRIDDSGDPFMLTGVNQRTPRYNISESNYDPQDKSWTYIVERVPQVDGVLNECLKWPPPP